MVQKAAPLPYTPLPQSMKAQLSTVPFSIANCTAYPDTCSPLDGPGSGRRPQPSEPAYAHSEPHSR